MFNDANCSVWSPPSAQTVELTVTAVLVGSVQLLSACGLFAVPLPLRSRLAPSFESQTLPALAHPLGGGSSCHKGIWIQNSPYFWSTKLALDKHLLPKCKKKKNPKNKNSPRDFGGNHGNCLLSRITVTFSKSSLFHQLWDTLKFTEFLNVVLLYLGAKCFCGRNPSPIK